MSESSKARDVVSKINLGDIVDVDATGKHERRGEYVVVLCHIDDDLEVPLADFHSASAAAVYAGNIREILRSWLDYVADELS